MEICYVNYTKNNNKKGISYRVLIRKKGLKTISKTFPNKKLANQFSLQVEGDLKTQLALGGKSNTKIFREVYETLQNR